MKTLRTRHIALAFSYIFIQGCSTTNEDSAIPKPKAGFTVSSHEVYKGETVTFSNTSTCADTYVWDFGDGTTSTESSPTHRFALCGSYTVRLTASADGISDTESETIDVTSRNIECQTLSAAIVDKQYFPTGEYVNGIKYKYCYRIKVSCSFFGYRQASRWGVIVGSSYHWWEAKKDDTNITLYIEHYTNTVPSMTSKITCRAYAVKKTGGNTYGDVFGNAKTLKLY